MFLISIKAEYEHKIKKILRTKKFRYKIDFFTEDDIYDKNNYSKYKFVITDYNKDVVEYFLKIGKKVLIIDDDEVPISSLFFNNKQVEIVKDVNNILYLLQEDVLKAKKKVQKGRVRKVAVAVVMILAFLVIFTISNRSSLEKTKKQEEPKETEVVVEEKEETSKKDYKKENYVFLGDSITDFYNLETFYDDMPVVNSGISGNQYKDLLYHLEDRVYKYNPTKVFLLIGTNDMAFTDITNEELVDRIIEICDEIHKHRKKTKIYVESIYPVNRKTNNNVVDLGMVLGRYNDRIQEINELLKEKVEENNYTYIDMYSKLEDEEGNLKVEYTVDGLHMSDEGYEVITSEIKKIIESE